MQYFRGVNRYHYHTGRHHSNTEYNMDMTFTPELIDTLLSYTKGSDGFLSERQHCITVHIEDLYSQHK